MENDEENEGSGTPPLELVKSYLAYGRRALRGHRLLAGVTTGLVVAATIGAVMVWPRSYSCMTVLAVQDSRIGEADKGGSLNGATELIMSQQNIASIVDELHLTKSWEASLSPLSRFKQKVMKLVRGPVNESAKRDALIATVTNSIYVQPPGWNENKLIITADWSDAKTAAALADAADQSFLRARHVAEISTITEYIGILEGHANELRDEIQSLAQQGKTDQKAAPTPVAADPALPAAPAPAPVVRLAPAPPKPTISAEDLSELRTELSEKQGELKAMEDSRNRRLAEAEQTLTELRTKFTSAHPMVVTAERNMAELSQVSPQLAQLRSDVKEMSDKLKAKTAIQKEEAAFRGPGRQVLPNAPGAIPGASAVEPLPADIMRLMQEDNQELDPAVTAQFRTAVNKYAALRDKIGSARVDLDTAQAAFKHRYQVVVPAAPPDKPSKPKVPTMIGAGLAFSLLLGFLATVIAELRKGKLVELWQVDRLGLPLLGDIRWPPSQGG